MRTDGTNHLRRAKSMKIGFLSGVTKPAHEGANALVLKSHSEPPAVVLLKSTFSAALAEKELEQKVRDFLSNSWMLNDALYEAAEDIAKDDSITDKQAALRDAVNEYIITLQQAAGISMNKAKGGKTEDGEVFPVSDYAYVPDPEKPSTWKLRLTATPGGEPDARIVGAALAALGPGYRGNKVEIPEADLAGVKNKVRSAWKKLHPDQEVPQVLKTAEEIEMSELELEKYKALAEMNDVHKAYHNSLPESDQEAFRKMDATARDALVTMAKQADESFTTIAGQVVQKSVAGPMYDVLKSQDEQLRKAQTEAALAKAKETVNADFAHIPGEMVQKTQMVMTLERLPEADRKFLVEKLKQADELWKARKEPAAPNGSGKGSSALEDMINEWLKANPGKTRTQAMQAISATKKGQEAIEAMRGDE